MKTIIFATGNEGKMREVREILKDLPVKLLSMKEAGISVEAEETGETFRENALLKAEALRPYTDAIVLADDSGLVIDALGGEPGVHSARYLGHDTSYTYKNQVILDRMKDVPEEERSARFVAAIAASLPNGEHKITEAAMEGRIAYESKGGAGFGYDPIFFLPEYGKTSAEILPEEKNAISHRGKALRAMRELLKEVLFEGSDCK